MNSPTSLPQLIPGQNVLGVLDTSGRKTYAAVVDDTCRMTGCTRRTRFVLVERSPEETLVSVALCEIHGKKQVELTLDQAGLGGVEVELLASEPTENRSAS